MSLTFKNISYSVGSKQILNNITGQVKEKDFIAIMGPSGSGKTTLLNILGGRLKKNVTGDYTGRPRKRDIGFVRQDDIMFPNLTVKETLLFTAQTRRPDLSRFEQDTEIDRLTKLLAIDHIVDSKVGDSSKRGISGGERRRVNICNELLSSPYILMLDEPTSGLDAASAIHLVEILRQLSDSGVTVICSIHQPPAETYYSFKKLIFLIDGNLVYFGKVNKLEKHLKSQRIKCDLKLNPADSIMKLVRKDTTGDIKRVLIDGWVTKLNSDYVPSAPVKRVKAKNNLFREIGLLTRRAFFQNSGIFIDWIGLGLLAFRSVFVGLIWFQALQYFSRVEEGPALIFSALLTISLFIPAYSALSTFNIEHTIIRRELDTGAYRLISYYLAKIIAEIPYLMIRPTLFLIIFYFMTGWSRTAESFIYAYSIIMANSFTSNAIGLVIAINSRDDEQAGNIIDNLLIITSMVAGFWARAIPVWISWIQYISPMAYSYQGLMLNEFTNKEYISNGTVVYRGEDILDKFTIWLDNKWVYFIILLGWNTFYRIIALFCLRFSFSKIK